MDWLREDSVLRLATIVGHHLSRLVIHCTQTEGEMTGSATTSGEQA